MNINNTMNRATRIIVLLILGIWSAGVTAQSYKLDMDISYTSKTDAYSLERLSLDVLLLQ